MARRIPRACLHRASGQAVVRLAGKDFYLGRWGTPQAQAAYHRKIAEYLAAGPVTVASPADRPQTVAELAALYLRHVNTWYAGTGGHEAEAVRSALRRMLRLYADTALEEFGPLALKSVRQAMAGESDTGHRAGADSRRPLCRSTVNAHVQRIRRMFRWAAENELIAAPLYQRLTTVAGLRHGRGGAEPLPREAVAWPDVRAVKPHLSRQVWSMVLLQYLTGMRSGELVRMRGADIDRKGAVWTYRPTEHKGLHLDRTRAVAIGPLAQRVLRPLLGDDPQACLFRPAEVEAEHNARRRRSRKTPLYPSHERRRRVGRRRRRPPGDRYTGDSYRRAVTRACQVAGIAPWTPHQLRHSCATRVRARFGLDAARAVLGHAQAGVTMEYAHLDLRKAVEAMARIG